MKCSIGSFWIHAQYLKTLESLYTWDLRPLFEREELWFIQNFGPSSSVRAKHKKSCQLLEWRFLPRQWHAWGQGLSVARGSHSKRRYSSDSDKDSLFGQIWIGSPDSSFWPCSNLGLCPRPAQSGFNRNPVSWTKVLPTLGIWSVWLASRRVLLSWSSKHPPALMSPPVIFHPLTPPCNCACNQSWAWSLSPTAKHHCRSSVNKVFLTNLSGVMNNFSLTISKMVTTCCHQPRSAELCPEAYLLGPVSQSGMKDPFKPPWSIRPRTFGLPRWPKESLASPAP